MSRAIVIYSSKRGSTRQYAEWIAEDLGCSAVPLEQADPASLPSYDVIVYGAWLRGSGILGWKEIQPHLRDLYGRTILFVTGISEYTPANYMQICEINFGGLGEMGDMQLFFTPGRYRPEEVKGLDRFLMKISRMVLKSGKTPEGATEADRMIEAIDHGIDRVDRRYTEQVVRAARKLLGEGTQE
ncbi:MAG: hypothetical protein IJH77_05620 [Mogibacterium sp.]|nr:hypothetical protein [Mogibacterium sp.]